MATEKRGPIVSVTERSRTPSLQSPRTPRFAEATQVISPIDGRSPFADPPMAEQQPESRPADVGFGYIADNAGAHHPTGLEVDESDANHLPPATPKSPLKSAMKSPGTAPRSLANPLSPTFREEQVLEKQEQLTDKSQAKDVAIKTRVRMAKMLLRGVNFSCSLIVLSMLATTFQIFNATKALPPRSSLTPWVPQQKIWPQVTVLTIACISLAMSIVIFYRYSRGGHKRAEKVAVYYTTFTVAFFVFSVVMWLVGAGILNQSKANGNGQDIWGWSCKSGKRKTFFENAVNYDLICRLQNWSLVCCIIEVIVEGITIAIYSIVFYRYYSKRRLRKSMAVRDKARSDLYLAQLRSQSAPNTPGFAKSPMPTQPSGVASPRGDGWRPPVDTNLYARGAAAEEGAAGYDPAAAQEVEHGVQYVTVSPQARTLQQPKPFTLQAPPSRHNTTPRSQQDGFEHKSPSTAGTYPPPVPIPGPPMTPNRTGGETRQGHVVAAPGEQQYDAVPIPGAYSAQIGSPDAAPEGMEFPGQAR